MINKQELERNIISGRNRNMTNKEALLGMMAERKLYSKKVANMVKNLCLTKCDYNSAITDSADLLSKRVATVEEIEQLSLGDFAQSYTNSQVIAYQMGVQKLAQALTKECIILKREEK